MALSKFAESAHAEAARLLRDPAILRSRCHLILQSVEAGRSVHFRIERSRLSVVAERVADLTRRRFADTPIGSYHSCWRHFEAGGVNRKAELDAVLAERSIAGMARARIDLALISALLGAGPATAWRYREAASGGEFSGEEGLALASFRAFMDGRFSSIVGEPHRVDARALCAMGHATLAEIFQVSDTNPLAGLDARVSCLHRLGEALRGRPEWFTAEGEPGHLFDTLTHRHHAPQLHHHHPVPNTNKHHLAATRILGVLLDTFDPIWPDGQTPVGWARGDVWPHAAAGGEGLSAGMVPFHMLLQRMTYALLPPFEWAGVRVHGLDELTGLPDTGAGGLLLDAGVLVPLDTGYASRPYTAADPWVIEWRALTVALLDELAAQVRVLLSLREDEWPLARLQDGGMRAAARQFADERRPGGAGAPPVRLQPDGSTVLLFCA